MIAQTTAVTWDCLPDEVLVHVMQYVTAPPAPSKNRYQSLARLSLTCTKIPIILKNHFKAILKHHLPALSQNNIPTQVTIKKPLNHSDRVWIYPIRQNPDLIGTHGLLFLQAHKFYYKRTDVYYQTNPYHSYGKFANDITQDFFKLAGKNVFKHRQDGEYLENYVKNRKVPFLIKLPSMQEKEKIGKVVALFEKEIVLTRKKQNLHLFDLTHNTHKKIQLYFKVDEIFLNQKNITIKEKDRPILHYYPLQSLDRPITLRLQPNQTFLGVVDDDGFVIEGDLHSTHWALRKICLLNPDDSVSISLPGPLKKPQIFPMDHGHLFFTDTHFSERKMHLRLFNAHLETVLEETLTGLVKAGETLAEMREPPLDQKPFLIVFEKSRLSYLTLHHPLYDMARYPYEVHTHEFKLSSK